MVDVTHGFANDGGCWSPVYRVKKGNYYLSGYCFNPNTVHLLEARQWKLDDIDEDRHFEMGDLGDINWPLCAAHFCILFWLHNTEENPKSHNKQLQTVIILLFFFFLNGLTCNQSFK